MCGGDFDPETACDFTERLVQNPGVYAKRNNDDECYNCNPFRKLCTTFVPPKPNQQSLHLLKIQ